jgi:hypothetical protein
MEANIEKEKQISHVCEYYRSFIQSAMEPILFENIEGIDWQILIGTLLQDKLTELYEMNQEDAIQFIFEHKPSIRVKDLLRSQLGENQIKDERRLGLDRRGSDRRDSY